MTVDHYLAVEESAAAELRGDWATAYERHRSVPMFAQSSHGADLRVLADLGDDAPRWMVSRFVTEMAHRLEMFGQERRSGRVLQRLVPTLYPDAIPFEQMDCEHPEQVPAMIFGRDWVVRQADVYDFEGLLDLLHQADPGGVSARSEHLDDWAAAPMGGWLVKGADGAVLRVADAASGDVVELLDLGLTAHVAPGSFVLGRVVPTDTKPGWLFDWRPLPVDRSTARAVARHPDRWLQIIEARTASRSLPPAFSHLSESSFSADLPSHSWGVLLGHPIDDDLPRPPASLAPEALDAALRLTGDAAAVRRHRHVLAELLLDEVVDAHLLARFAIPQHQAAWRVLAAQLPSYAARRADEALWLIDAGTSEGLAG